MPRLEEATHLRMAHKFLFITKVLLVIGNEIPRALQITSIVVSRLLNEKRHEKRGRYRAFHANSICEITKIAITRNWRAPAQSASFLLAIESGLYNSFETSDTVADLADQDHIIFVELRIRTL